MEIATLVGVLDQPHLAADHLHAWGLADVHRARQTLHDLADSGLTLDLLAALCAQLSEQLPSAADPDAALDALRRFLLASRSPLALAALFERDETALAMLLAVFSLGPTWQELVIADPEAFDLLRMTEGQPVSRGALLGDVCAEVASFSDERAVMSALQRVRQRETLRIAYGERHAGHKYELVSEQLTFLAEALVAAALQVAVRKCQQPRGSQRRAQTREPRVAVIALSRLGGAEMDYGDALELLLVYDAQADDEPARKAAQEQMDRCAKLLMKLLAEAGGEGPGFRVQLIPLPDSPAPLSAHTLDDAVLGFDSFGRTWHRQAMLRARPIAGDLPLGADVLRRLEPWIFRRYLSQADETGIQALRRRLLRQAAAGANAACDVVHSRGGLADLEAGVQFLQLLVGGDRPAVRPAGTLDAIAGLEQAEVLTPPERTLLEEGYAWLRQVLHRLQTAVGPDATAVTADDTLADRCRQRMAKHWEALSRLLTTSVPESDSPPIVDLLLDPAPNEAELAAALGPYQFARPAAALANLQDLATERIPFLSTRRCRHFLSLIAGPLLAAIAATPDPDATLDNLRRVSDSLGSKGVLWELFSFHPPSLALYVRLCAASPYLSDILTTNPGMIDDLVDSLQLDKLPTLAELEDRLAELSRGGRDPLPILHHLKNASHLRIGVRDILGKESIEATHRALADVAEFSLNRVAQHEFAKLTEKFGLPTLGPGPFEGEPCQLVILALGKLGGREPNYHSSVEVAFLYEGEGTTRPQSKTRREQRTANNHFFTQLAQRVLKEISQLTPQGRLYSIELLLRPIGVGGAMALSLGDFSQHFTSAAAQVWQWQTLCKARPIFGPPPARQAVEHVLRQLLVARPWNDADQAEIYRSRLGLERGASPLNLKRGPGGTLDVEFLVQMLQLQHAAAAPQVLSPSTQDALSALAAARLLDQADAQALAESYRFLRQVESGLRLLATSARHDLPENPLELRKLALLLGEANADEIRTRALDHMADNRRRFERIVRSPLARSASEG